MWLATQPPKQHAPVPQTVGSSCLASTISATLFYFSILPVRPKRSLWNGVRPEAVRDKIVAWAPLTLSSFTIDARSSDCWLAPQAFKAAGEGGAQLRNRPVPGQISRTMPSAARSTPSIDVCSSMSVLMWVSSTRLAPIFCRCSRRLTQLVWKGTFRSKV